jgi:predicted flap endonuclease-1-like 5' DNA nuclease
MRKHRVSRLVAALFFLGALLFFLIGLIAAISIATSGIGHGWGVGWRGWIWVPVMVAAFLNAIGLAVLGAVLFFLTKIENNLYQARAEREARAAEAALPPSTVPSAPRAATGVAAATDTTVSLAGGKAEPKAGAPATAKAPNHLPGAEDAARIAAEMSALNTTPRQDAPAVGPPKGNPDDFTRIKGIGPMFAQRLHEAGIASFAALAEAGDDVLDRVTGGNLDRVQREDWRGQARQLSG